MKLKLAQFEVKQGHYNPMELNNSNGEMDELPVCNL